MSLLQSKDDITKYAFIDDIIFAIIYECASYFIFLLFPIKLCLCRYNGEMDFGLIQYLKGGKEAGSQMLSFGMLIFLNIHLGYSLNFTAVYHCRYHGGHTSA